MNTFQFWLDIHCAGSPACTLFGSLDMPVRPLAGERISFHQEKGSDLQFQHVRFEAVCSREASVSVEVEEVSHYSVRRDGRLVFTSVIRAHPLNVSTLDDVRVVRDILTKQCGLAVDPYGINVFDAEG
ncbi:hypothetical protein [Ideonella sp.]|jgi:hypothetical protein|uniref:hypothetical protein n=1 Tax=Ideonella sp. TaxID=1929293 RepID=UPI0037BE81EF